MEVNRIYNELRAQCPVTSTFHPTFLIVELAQNDDGQHCNTYIVDPTMPESGGPSSYFELEPTQRMALEIAELVSIASTNICGVVYQAPLDEELWKRVHHSKKVMAKLVRFLAMKGANMSIAAKLEVLEPSETPSKGELM